MQCLWDADISEVLKGKNRIVVQKASAYLHQYKRLSLSLITRYEVLRGLKAKGSSRLLAKFEQMGLRDEILPISEEIIVRASDLWAHLSRQGQLGLVNDFVSRGLEQVMPPSSRLAPGGDPRT